jgi:hypothetical protein
LLTDFHESWYEGCATGGHPKAVLFKISNNIENAIIYDAGEKAAQLTLGSLNDN